MPLPADTGLRLPTPPQDAEGPRPPGASSRESYPSPVSGSLVPPVGSNRCHLDQSAHFLKPFKGQDFCLGQVAVQLLGSAFEPRSLHETV